MEIDIDVHTATELTLALLKSDYASLQQNINRLKKLKKNLTATDVQIQDLELHKKYAKAYRRIMEYYGG